MSSYKIEAGTAQHIGSRPQQNDRVALLTGARAPGYVLAVLSDGVDGADAPEQVLLTAKNVFDLFKPGDRPSHERLGQLLREIIEETNLIVKMNAVAHKAEAQGTVAALLLGPHGDAVWAHVGDSRLYHFREGKCLSRSNDSAYVEYLMDTEKLPAEAARNHRKSSLLANMLGNTNRAPFITIGSASGVGPGDVFLLASDGLWHYFTDAELGGATARATPRQASEMLINKAGERSQGRGDNCSMVIVKVVQPVQQTGVFPPGPGRAV
jgi:PPM family protein phosphatase